MRCRERMDDGEIVIRLTVWVVYRRGVTTLIARIASLISLALAAAVTGCAGPGAPGDAGADAPATCASAGDCDDGLFCTGLESCAPGNALADGRGCVAASGPPCALAVCDEDLDRCNGCDDDADGDGARSVACGGNDCDDEDEDRFPGNLEVCDPSGVDEDCNDTTLGDVDLDDDFQIDDACCNGARCGLDCDDSRPNVHRLAPEVCDGFDNDCNGMTDEGVLVSSWPDEDEDDWGDAAATPTVGCTVPTGRVDRGGDCNDADEDVHPTTSEPCNGTDDDCDGMTDEGGVAACEAERPGSVAQCLNGACVVTGCTGSRFDCNGDSGDGCEVDVCTSVSACDNCGHPCSEPGAVCAAGTCSHTRPEASSANVLRDASTGAPIAGATITLLGTCSPHASVTNAAGEYDILHRSVAWARIEAPGYPVHVQPRSAVDGSFGPLVSQAALDAWLATQDVTPDPSRAILVAHITPMLTSDLVSTTARLGTRLYAEPGDLSPWYDEVLLNVLPGRATVGGNLSNGGCYTDCGPLVNVMLEAGAVTYVGDFECRTYCS